eukprot:96271_1
MIIFNFSFLSIFRSNNTMPARKKSKQKRRNNNHNKKKRKNNKHIKKNHKSKQSKQPKSASNSQKICKSKSNKVYTYEQQSDNDSKQNNDEISDILRHQMNPFANVPSTDGLLPQHLLGINAAPIMNIMYDTYVKMRHVPEFIATFEFDMIQKGQNKLINISFDYVLIGKQMDYGIKFTNTMGKAFFTLCCNRANNIKQSNADTYLGLMFQILSRIVNKINGYTIHDLQTQLVKEYKREINWNDYA